MRKYTSRLDLSRLGQWSSGVGVHGQTRHDRGGSWVSAHRGGERVRAAPTWRGRGGRCVHAGGPGRGTQTGVSRGGRRGGSPRCRSGGAHASRSDGCRWPRGLSC